MEKLLQTPSQTVGPFFAYGLAAEQYGYDYTSIINGALIDEETPGERIYITGSIFDGKGVVIPDALIELWQADRDGRYRTLAINKKNEGFTGIGRLGTGTHAGNRFIFTTVKPGAINKMQAPHINVMIFMRGSLRHLYTRMYFSDEINDNDHLLNAIDEKLRRTLIAQRKDINGTVQYNFDIYMQGENETVFFGL